MSFVLSVLMLLGVVRGAPIEIDFTKIDLDGRSWITNFDTGSEASAGAPSCPVIMMPGDRIKEVNVKLPENLTNWQECNQVTFRIFSPEADDAKIIVVIYPKDGGGNWWKRITADWKGWKDIEVKISDFTYSNSQGKKSDPKTFCVVDKIGFANMWGTGNPTWAREHGILIPTAHTWGFLQIIAE